MKDEKPVPFRYVAKASRSERDRGCEALFWHYPKGSSSPVQVTKEEYDTLQKQGERVTSGNIHSTVKPIEVMEWLIETLTEPGDTILDPFAGSGTTGIAAINTGRDCHLIELNEDGTYEPIIRGRLKAAKEYALNDVPVWESPPEIDIPGDDEESYVVEEIGFMDLLG